MPLRFTLRQLEYLVAVADSGSVALAAERVNVSSPSISAAIAQLEAEFGLHLFIRRHAQGLSLTEGGRQFTATARGVLAAAGRLSDSAAEITGEVRGALAVGCLQTFAQVVLPQVRRSFADRFPQVEMRQSERHQAALFEGLRNASLDVALTYAMQIPADLRFEPLAPLAPYALLPEEHPLAGQSQVSTAELAPFPMVLLDLPHSADYFLSLFSAEGLRPLIAERTRDMGMMRSLVANGFGYSIANIRQAGAIAPDGRRLVEVPMAGPRLEIGLVLPQGPLRRAVSAFLDHCRIAVPPAAGARG
ncbi:MAG: LysR substrate-binding domain-containing protein [Paracoccaceae bacterium]